MSEIAERLKALAAFWNRLESRTKAAEQFRHQTITASINEMRYAGRRIVDCLNVMNNGDGSEKAISEINEHLIIAKTYLINADHDITDSICFVIHKRISRTVNRYGIDKVCQHVDKFGEIYPLVAEANKIIQGSREDRLVRIKEYERLRDEYLPKLMPLYDSLVKVPELAVEEPETAEMRTLRNRVSFIKWLAIIASIAGILGVIISLVAWIYTWSEFKTDILHIVPAKIQQH